MTTMALEDDLKAELKSHGKYGETQQQILKRILTRIKNTKTTTVKSDGRAGIGTDQAGKEIEYIIVGNEHEI